jgi:hypothetical protein
MVGRALLVAESQPLGVMGRKLRAPSEIISTRRNLDSKEIRKSAAGAGVLRSSPRHDQSNRFVR